MTEPLAAPITPGRNGLDPFALDKERYISDNNPQLPPSIVPREHSDMERLEEVRLVEEY